MNAYLSIARPSHWFKNIFIVPGLLLSLLTYPDQDIYILLKILIGLISVCLITSANYTINEWLDAPYDRFHPVKKERPSVLGHIQFKYVVVQYIALISVGLTLAYTVSMNFFLTSGALLTMGTLYNVLPFRTKDKPYLDVLSESINNPLRLLLGWFMLDIPTLPPTSLLIAYWMGGSFLMASKRFAELKMIENKDMAKLYRKSFAYYTEKNLLLSSICYAMLFSFFFAIFVIKYKIEYIITFPFFALLFSWYVSLSMNKDSPAQRPERLYKEKAFMAYCLFIVFLSVFAFFIHIPLLDTLLDQSVFAK